MSDVFAIDNHLDQNSKFVNTGDSFSIGIGRREHLRLFIVIGKYFDK